VLTVVLMLPGALVAVPPFASDVLHPCFVGQDATELVTVPYALLLSEFRSLPVPLKSFDCLASSVQKQGDVVVQAVVEGGGVIADRLIEIDWPGARFRFLKPTVVPPLKKMTQTGAELLNDARHVGSDVRSGNDALITEKPAGALGTFRLSEPSWIPDPSLLSLVNVTDRLDGFVAVPPGPVTAGLAGVQPVWPPPQITIEYGLLGVAPAPVLRANAAREATNSVTAVRRNRRTSIFVVPLFLLRTQR
jgi:hypothetical protein